MSRRQAILQDYGGSFQPMPQDSQLQAAQLQQRRNESEMQMKQHQLTEKNKQTKESSDFISGLGVDHIGDNTVDLLTDKQIQNLQEKLTAMQLSGASTTDIKITAQRELPKIVNGHTVAKNNYDKIKAGTVELGKDYPTGNLEAARSIATKSMLKDVLDFDENGKATGYKDASLIPDKNYISPLTDESMIEQWYNPSGALEAHIKTLPVTKIGESKKYRDKKGVERDNIWEGQGSVFSKLKTDENGATIGQEIKSETVPIGKNADGTINNAIVLPKEEFDVLTGTPTAKADFTIKFNKHLRDIGIDPKGVDPRAKDILQRQFAHDYLTGTNIDGSSFIIKDAVKQPLPPRISIKVNNTKTDPTINDVYDQIDSRLEQSKIEGAPYLQVNLLQGKAPNLVLDEAKKATGNNDLEQKDIMLIKDENGIGIFHSKTSDKPGELIKYIDKVSTNLPVQANAKAKAEVVKQGNPKKSQPEIVEQNGHRYKLNKSTGKYEPIK